MLEGGMWVEPRLPTLGGGCALAPAREPSRTPGICSPRHGLPGDRSRDHQRTRGGGASPCASSHETTGLRRTPIRSISASITSPGLR